MRRHPSLFAVSSVAVILLSIPFAPARAQLSWPDPGETLYVTDEAHFDFSQGPTTLGGTIVATGDDAKLFITNSTTLDFADFRLVTTDRAYSKIDNSGSIGGSLAIETTNKSSLDFVTAGNWTASLTLSNDNATTGLWNNGAGSLSGDATMVNSGWGNLSINNAGTLAFSTLDLTTNGAHTDLTNNGWAGGPGSWTILDQWDDSAVLNNGTFDLHSLSLIAQFSRGYSYLGNNDRMQFGQLILHANDGGILDIANYSDTPIRAGLTDIAVLGIDPKTGYPGAITIAGGDIEPLQPVPAPSAIGLVIFGAAPLLLRTRRKPAPPQR